MSENHSSTLTQKAPNQLVALQSNRLKNNNLNSKSKRKNPKSKNRNDNNPNPNPPLNLNQPKIQVQNLNQQKSTSELTSKENKSENLCPDSDSEFLKDSNKHKTTTLS